MIFSGFKVEDNLIGEIRLKFRDLWIKAASYSFTAVLVEKSIEFRSKVIFSTLISWRDFLLCEGFIPLNPVFCFEPSLSASASAIRSYEITRLNYSFSLTFLRLFGRCNLWHILKSFLNTPRWLLVIKYFPIVSVPSGWVRTIVVYTKLLQSSLLPLQIDFDGVIRVLEGHLIIALVKWRITTHVWSKDPFWFSECPMC